MPDCKSHDIPDIDPERVGPAAAFANLRRRFLDTVDDVVDDDVRAALREEKGMAPPHPAAGAGHQGNSTFQ